MEQQSSKIETWVHSLDKEVTTLGRAQAGITSKLESHELQLDRIETGLDKVCSLITAPKPPTNMIGAIGIIASLIIVFGLFFELRIAPTEQINTLMYTNMVEMSDELGRRAALISNHEARLSQREFAFAHLDQQHHATEAAVTALQISVGGLEAVSEYKKAEKLAKALEAIQ